MRNLKHALIATVVLAAAPIASQAAFSFGISVGFAPPPLPVYVQPPCPAPGYIWMPGYWAWDEDSGYYWVPGTWAMAPEVGLLWTPGYWSWAEGAYLWHAGYWGPHVGFYGGINYGFGYTGVGYEGGYWRGSDFYYNRSVTNINTTYITNVYSSTVVSNGNLSRVSFNGGEGGVMARPTPADLSAERERHVGMTPVQRQQEQLARTNPGLRADLTGGRPIVAATPKPGAFDTHGVAGARESHPAPQFQASRQPMYPASHEPPRYAAPHEPTYTAPHEPRYAAPHEPMYTAPHEPMYTAPHEPMYSAGHQPAYSAGRQPVYSPAREPVYAPRPQAAYPTAAARPARVESPYGMRAVPQYPPRAPAERPSPAYPSASHAMQGPHPEHGGAAERPGERNRHG